ncbi:pentapeptide repeat-containing protein [Pseudomonas citri]|uniref:pentapeptide repeat-containing protein n=1 Tax=Pseudomonas citri TaxID=2978349 RepID=UPI0021B4E35B|nr:pentapeptide repeat-containing protein [Pseudomonas citri]
MDEETEMTNPAVVKTYIGCYYLTVVINNGLSTSTWFAYRQGDSLACKLSDNGNLDDATLFAFYLGDSFTPDSVSLGAHNWLQVQSVSDGAWLDFGSSIPGGAKGDFYVALTYPDTPATLALSSGTKYGIPPSNNTIWMELVQGKSVVSVFYIDILDNTVVWTDVEKAVEFANLSAPVTTKQLLPAAWDLNKQSYDGTDFGYLFLDNADFSETRVTNSNLSHVTFSGTANFPEAVLDGSNFSGCKLDGASFCNASLKGADFSNASLKGCDFAGAVLDNCNFEGADLANADLSLASLSDLTQPIRITRDVNNRTIFSNARVNKVLTHVFDGENNDLYIWSYAQMDGVQFMMEDPDHPGAAILDGVLDNLIAQYAVLTGVQFGAFDSPSIRYADFSYAQLGGANLVKANLEYAKFDYAIFSTPDGKHRCNLGKAYLLNASFSNADLSYAMMSYCYLFGNKATLVGATILQVDFTGAYLVATDFSGLGGKNAAGVTFDSACLINAKFNDVDLTTVQDQRACSFANACLQGVDFSGANTNGVNFAGAAVSTDTGTLTVHHGREDTKQISYKVTVTPTDTTGAMCPNDQTGPCTGTMWHSNDAPMNDWNYEGDN